MSCLPLPLLCWCAQTLNYLRIVYAREWANFQERLVSRADVRGALEQHSSSMDAPTAADIREAAFLPGRRQHLD